MPDLATLLAPPSNVADGRSAVLRGVDRGREGPARTHTVRGLLLKMIMLLIMLLMMLLLLLLLLLLLMMVMLLLMLPPLLTNT